MEFKETKNGILKSVQKSWNFEKYQKNEFLQTLKLIQKNWKYEIYKKILNFDHRSKKIGNLKIDQTSYEILTTSKAIWNF